MYKTKLNIVELCSGIGCQYRGIENTDCFEPNVVATSEINAEAVVSYAAIHNGLTKEMIAKYDYPPMEEMREYLADLNIGYNPEKDKVFNWYRNGKEFEKKVKKIWLACKLNKNYGDVSKIEKLPEADLWFLSFPCQSISVSGRLGGMKEDSGTRSSLVWHTIRLLRVAKENNTLPKYMILENVKNLVSKRFIEDFNQLNSVIEDEFNFSVRYEVLNAKECGIPQNRERVFALYVQKDIDNNYFTFPQPFDIGIRLKDVLQDEVDEKYYVDTEKSDTLILKLINDGMFYIDDKDGDIKTKNGVKYG